MTPAPHKPRAKKAPAKKPVPDAAVAPDAPTASPARVPAPPPPAPPVSPPPTAPAVEEAIVALPSPDMSTPAVPEAVATPVDYIVPRPNLLDTGLSDYSFWVSHVEGLTPEPLPNGARTGRIWA